MLMPFILVQIQLLFISERGDEKITEIRENLRGLKQTVIGSGRTSVVIYSLARDVTMDTSAVQKTMSGRKNENQE